MKFVYSIILILAIHFPQFTLSQETVDKPERYTAKNKGKLFVFWGGNRENYSKSDIRFKGEDYDFTLHNVAAHDLPKGYHIDYFNPTRMTIPQTNAKIGYFITDHYNISVGVDHMKYVMYNDRRVNFSGFYPDAGSFNENPVDNELTLDEDFLLFEHTNGLNYVYAEIARVDDVSGLFGEWNTDKFQINITEGIGGGVLYPRTNTTLLEKERYDQFHIAGYGMSLKAGLNFTFFKHFFIHAELKGGYIEMNDIRTTNNRADSAEQNFWFLQRILALGGIFRV